MVCEREGCEREVPPAKAPGTVPRFCTENCRKRACDERNRSACVDCGDSLSARSGWANKHHHLYLRCRSCDNARRREERDQRWQRIEWMWHDGMLMREIADELGVTIPHVSVEIARMRKAGRDVPHRYRGYDAA